MSPSSGQFISKTTGLSVVKILSAITSSPRVLLLYSCHLFFLSFVLRLDYTANFDLLCVTLNTWYSASLCELPACCKVRLRGCWCGSVAKSMTLQSVKVSVLLESWVQPCCAGNFKGICTNVYDSVIWIGEVGCVWPKDRLLKSQQCILFCGLHLNIGSLRPQKKIYLYGSVCHCTS